MKNFLLILIVLVGCIACEQFSTALEDGSTIDSNSKEVHVYSDRTFEVDQKIYALFEKETGIKVLLTQKKGALLLEQLIEEGKDALADVLICFDAGQMQAARKYNLLDSLKNEALDEKVPLAYRNPQRFWYGIGRRTKVIAYNRALVKNPTEILTYADLTKPVWDVSINISSSADISNRSLLASIIANKGAEHALNWVQGISKNLAIKPSGDDFDRMVALASGTGKIALVNSNAAAKFLEKNPHLHEKIGIIFPNQETTGAHVNLSAGGRCQFAKNKANATKLLIFLASKKVQQLLTEENFEYPINPAINPAKILEGWGDFQADPLDYNFLESNYPQAKEILGQAARW